MSYADNLASAKKLLTEKGQAVTLTVSSGDYDTSTSSVTLAPTVMNTVGVVLPLSKGLMNMPGTTIQVGDRQLLLPGDVQPTVGTKVTIGGVDSTIVQVSPLNPGGTTVLVDCVIR